MAKEKDPKKEPREKRPRKVKLDPIPEETVQEVESTSNEEEIAELWLVFTVWPCL